jgi:hypothetical protein
MHRAIAAWLTAHPLRAVLLAALLGVLSPPMLGPFTVATGAISVLLGLERGAIWMLAAAAGGTITSLWVLSSLAEPLVSTLDLGNVAVLLLGPAALTLLLRATGSLNLCFQVAVLVAALVLIGVHMAMDDPVGFWVPKVRDVVDSLTKAGIALQNDPETMTAALAKMMWGTLTVMTLCSVLFALWLGRWWHSLLHAPGSFGREYQQLRVGTVLGLGASLVLVLALVSDSHMLSALVWLVFAALSLQGLAAAHRSRARGNLNRGWLAAIYVLLIVPLSTAVTIVALAIWGFADNWTRRNAQQV